MQIKYLNQIGEMIQHYENIFDKINTERFSEDEEIRKIYTSSLAHWGVGRDVTIAELKEEYFALRYLLRLRLRFGYTKRDRLNKPSLDVINRTLNRHLLCLKQVHGVVRTSRFKSSDYRHHIAKQVKACHHYLFQFTLHAWVAKLPECLEEYKPRYDVEFEEDFQPCIKY